MELLPLYLWAFVYGAAHAIEPDHVAAVTTFVVRKPRPLQAAGFGARWAAGHGAAIFVVGVLLLLVGREIPESWTDVMDRLVGVAMVALGTWTVAGARALHAHAHTHPDGTTHAHLHSHATTTAHEHRHAATAVGLLHGLAGTGPAVALIPLMNMRSTHQGAVYLFLFGVGTAAGMASYAFLAGAFAERLAAVSEKVGRLVTSAAGAFAIVIGLVWIFR